MNEHDAEPGRFSHLAGLSDVSRSTRRQFLQVMGASMALASSGCMPQPTETIVPYVRSPEYFVPGRPKYFASAITLGGYATGVLVESHLGRPTKIEGNPDHPSSLGAVDSFSQASVLSLYDPDRSQAISHRGEVQTWQAFATAITALLTAQQSARGAGLRILTETITSPTLAWQLQQLLEQYPQARWYQYEPVNHANKYQGSILAFGSPIDTVYHFEQADVVLAIDSDFLACGPGSLVYSRELMAGRDPLQWDPVHSAAEGAANRRTEPNRLFAIEPAPTCTGTVADHRLALRPGEMEAAVHYLAHRIIRPRTNPAVSGLNQRVREWLDIAAQELLTAGPRAAVVGGETLQATSHALIHGINTTLGNAGTTVQYIAPVASQPQNQIESIRQLAREMDAGDVALLIVLGGNPVFDAPADLRFHEKLKKVAAAVHVSSYEDETSAECEWHIPLAHELESWGDARAYNGTASIIQPLIAPLYEGKTFYEVAGLLLGNSEANGYEIVRNYWRGEWGEEGFEARWHEALHLGVIEGTRPPAESTKVQLVEAFEQQLENPPSIPLSAREIEISIRPDPTIYDGRFANNGWLQELPKPITKLTWDNAALMSADTAKMLGVGREDVVRIRTSTGRVSLPVWIVPGHVDHCITVHLGYGRRRGGKVAVGTGANVYRIRSSQHLWSILDANVQKTEARYTLACTQLHQQMEHSDPAHWFTLDEYRQHRQQMTAEHAAHQQDEPADPDEPGVAHEHPNLYDPEDRPTDDADYAWGMSVNLNTCIGCGACVVACQAENNIPVVGKEMVQRSREMHWLRIDTYIDERHDDEIVIHQPVACVHCEHAPCEVVCPVGATVHSAEGLNEMVYNRCVGTRYCSHNCPYKVRRFNFFNYTDDYPPTLQLLQNPDVTVRMRGVMEKCTYCVQRISAARISAKKEGRNIQDGEVITACQGACPTRAIQFGDLRNPHSVVAQQKQHPLDYGLLEELNTRPRTTYLARVTNPNQQLPQGTATKS